MFSEWNPASAFDNAVEWTEPRSGQKLRVVEDHTRSILSENRNPDLDFRWSLNPYRGCFHGCAYCYARPTHEYLGFGAGTDFERRLVVKPRAPELLREVFLRRSWVGEVVVFSGNTDCYQPLELKWKLTRRCLQVCREFDNPVGLITHSALVARDADVLADLDARVTFSMPLWDPVVARKLEPGVPPPRRRLEALAELAAHGVPVGINIAPCIPGLTEQDVPTILREARAAGAQWAHFMPLWLPPKTAEVFARRLAEHLPNKGRSIVQRHVRRRGQLVEVARERSRPSRGPEWPAAKRLFAIQAERLGYEPPPERGPTPFRRPTKQVSLFPGPPTPRSR